jgi:hypothetical protein
MPSPQPCEASHGYWATIAHHEEAGVRAGGHASAPSVLRGATAVGHRRAQHVVH